ncbi:FHA domain-containing protein FhaB/FipA [Bifidobacterium scardovii]|uniref:FHA domain containing protein n=1 Tax=Bifidobacterium scardovii TaxID=158787 RepID=A0A087DDW3_9BIFI|nr:FHA domain-containing protein [Bifidobacterium scardovii]KFI93713.1 FHA domain containing protein [Bifidobacterium scardovii]MBS6946962.1 FHA domain-containing protein [Bifidobacterium scardovii]MDK6350359.1 FHA domain-containing protein [Bifidobacterium scardovii]MDU2422081.1 FHA domain-containing protein [Bifidobacterium scardovii]MDU3736626.1 FHA domain-containing protein [Bifidobacterium scardovii]
MLTELTFAILKFGFLIFLWLCAGLAIRSLYKDMETYSPRASRAHRRKERRARKAVAAPAPVATASAVPSTPRTNEMPATNASPTLLVIIDGPLAGSSVPLTEGSISLGRSASNTVVLNDEFVSSHHARVYQDPATGSWAIEDLNSTNGTVVNGQRINTPTILSARVPVRIGATTFELR